MPFELLTNRKECFTERNKEGCKKIRRKRHGVTTDKSGITGRVSRCRVGDGINSGLNRAVAIAGINNFVRLCCNIAGLWMKTGESFCPSWRPVHRNARQVTSYLQLEERFYKVTMILSVCPGTIDTSVPRLITINWVHDRLTRVFYVDVVSFEITVECCSFFQFNWHNCEQLIYWINKLFSSVSSKTVKFLRQLDM